MFAKLRYLWRGIRRWFARVRYGCPWAMLIRHDWTLGQNSRDIWFLDKRAMHLEARVTQLEVHLKAAEKPPAPKKRRKTTTKG